MRGCETRRIAHAEWERRGSPAVYGTVKICSRRGYKPADSMEAMPRLTFLGTGEYLTSERYWNGFVIDGHILVETSPTVLPHIRRCGLDVADLDVIFLSHFHADHTFGWPFLLLELIRRRGLDPVFIVGPPGVEARLRDMMEVGGVSELWDAAKDRLDLRWVEADEGWQVAGSLQYRAVEVEHVPHLRCFGYMLDFRQSGSQAASGADETETVAAGEVLPSTEGIVGYSGDVRPCQGLDTLAAGCDTLVLECNGPHPSPKTHMDVADVADLRLRFPGVRLILTHLGPGINAEHIHNCVTAEDFQTIDV
jgi:ribonuclease Z